jgi:hypothetical protein
VVPSNVRQLPVPHQRRATKSGAVTPQRQSSTSGILKNVEGMVSSGCNMMNVQWDVMESILCLEELIVSKWVNCTHSRNIA